MDSQSVKIEKLTLLLPEIAEGQANLTHSNQYILIHPDLQQHVRVLGRLYFKNKEPIKKAKLWGSAKAQ